MAKQQDDEGVKPPEVQSEEVHKESPEVQAGNDPLINPKIKKMLDAAKGVGEAEEGEPKTKAERAFEKAKDDFLDEFSTVDKDGNPKMPKDEGEALAEILAKALMALMTPLKMGAAASGLTQAKDDKLDAMGDKAKEAAGDLLAKMKDIYNKKDDKKDDKKDEVLSVSDGPKIGAHRALAEDLSKQSEKTQKLSQSLLNTANEGAGAGKDVLNLVSVSLTAIKASHGLADAAAKFQANDPGAQNALENKSPSISLLELTAARPKPITPKANEGAEEAATASWKRGVLPTPEPKPDEDKSKKLR